MAAPAAGVDFDRNRLSTGEMIAGVSGLVLFFSMFLDWYGIKVSTPVGSFGASGGPNAWQSFDFIDWLLFLALLIAVGVAVLRALDRMPEMPYPPDTLVAIAGAVAFLLILFRLVATPFDVPDGVDVTRKFGLFLGLLSAAGIAYGGWRAMQEAPSTPGTAGGGAAAPTAATTTMPASGGAAAADPGVPGGGAAGVSPGKEGPGVPNPGTSTGGPDDTDAEPPPAAAADPVPGTTGSQTPPGLAGEPPAGEGTHPPGI